MDNNLAKMKQAARVHKFDGSSEELVRHTLEEQLEKILTGSEKIMEARGGIEDLCRGATSAGTGSAGESGAGGSAQRAQMMNSGKSVLIVDEYHFLSSENKNKLFRRFDDSPSNIQVYLIANRIDANDRARVDVANEQCTAGTSAGGHSGRVGNGPTSKTPVSSKFAELIETRLAHSAPQIGQMFEALGVSDSAQEKIRRWLHASGLLFGDEARSLRLISSLNNLFKADSDPEKLVDILLQKVPKISTTTARDFVKAFCGHSVSTPTGAMFEVAMFDYGKDGLSSFPELLERMVYAVFYVTVISCMDSVPLKNSSQEQMHQFQEIDLSNHQPTYFLLSPFSKQDISLVKLTTTTVCC